MLKLKVDDEINLCLVHESHAVNFHRLVEDSYEHLAQWLHWPRLCKTEDGFREFIKGSLHKYADGNGVDFAVEYKGLIVGNCGFNSINTEISAAEIGYWLSHKHTGLGIMTRCCRFLIDYAFNELKVEKVQITAAEHNQPSRAVIERLGLKLEGIITNRERVGDRILNHAVYGIHKTSAGASALH